MEEAVLTEKPKKRIQYRSRYGTVDSFTLILVLAFVVFGIIMVFSASYYTSISESGDAYEYLKKDALYAGIGLMLLLVCMFVDYHIWFRASPVLLFLSFLLMIALVIPKNPLAVTLNSATRWLQIPGVPMTIMPGEIAKVAIVLFAARFLSRNPRAVHKFGGIAFLGVIAIAFLVLYLLQPNLSTAITFCLVLFVMMLVSGLHWGWLLLAGGAGAAVFFGLPVFFPDHYWTRRIMSFTDPFADPKGSGWQAVESIYALATGGVKGTGLGNSIIKALYLPEPMNDYILAVIGEELGFIGCAGLLIAYLLLIYKLMKISIGAKDSFGLLLGTGFTAMLAIQVLLNVAVVTSSIPSTGIALPFISYGGNALVLFMASMGIVLNISKQSRKPEDMETTEPGERSETK